MTDRERAYEEADKLLADSDWDQLTEVLRDALLEAEARGVESVLRDLLQGIFVAAATAGNAVSHIREWTDRRAAELRAQKGAA